MGKSERASLYIEYEKRKRGQGGKDPKQADMILSCPANFLQKALLPEERKLKTHNGSCWISVSGGELTSLRLGLMSGRFCPFILW